MFECRLPATVSTRGRPRFGPSSRRIRTAARSASLSDGDSVGRPRLTRRVELRRPRLSSHVAIIVLLSDPAVNRSNGSRAPERRVLQVVDESQEQAGELCPVVVGPCIECLLEMTVLHGVDLCDELRPRAVAVTRTTLPWALLGRRETRPRFSRLVSCRLTAPTSIRASRATSATDRGFSRSSTRRTWTACCETSIPAAAASLREHAPAGQEPPETMQGLVESSRRGVRTRVCPLHGRGGIAHGLKNAGLVASAGTWSSETVISSTVGPQRAAIGASARRSKP